jgi:hypothetical protein
MFWIENFNKSFSNFKALLPSWPKRDIVYLYHIFCRINWNEVIEKSKCATQNSHRPIFIVASANTPISLLFPCVKAIESGFSFVSIKLPSIRANDLLMVMVLNQIREMFFLVVQKLPHASVKIEEDLNSVLPQDKLIVFGTDKTVNLFRCSYGHNNVLGFGDHFNFFECQKKENILSLLKSVCCFQGRGCLTPVGVFFNENISIEKKFIHKSIKILSTKFLDKFSSRIHIAKDFYAQLAFLTSEKEADERVFYTEKCLVLNFIGINNIALKNLRIMPTLFGQGNVFLATTNQRSIFESKFSQSIGFENIFPLYEDEHEGKTWSEWFEFSHRSLHV